MKCFRSNQHARLAVSCREWEADINRKKCTESPSLCLTHSGNIYLSTREIAVDVWEINWGSFQKLLWKNSKEGFCCVADRRQRFGGYAKATQRNFRQPCIFLSHHCAYSARGWLLMCGESQTQWSHKLELCESKLQTSVRHSATVLTCVLGINYHLVFNVVDKNTVC